MFDKDHSHTEIERAFVALFYASSTKEIKRKLGDVRRALLSHFSYSEERLFPFLGRLGFSKKTLSELQNEHDELLLLTKNAERSLESIPETFATCSRVLLQKWTQHDANENNAMVGFWERVAQSWEDA